MSKKPTNEAKRTGRTPTMQVTAMLNELFGRALAPATPYDAALQRQQEQAALERALQPIVDKVDAQIRSIIEVAERANNSAEKLLGYCETYKAEVERLGQDNDHLQDWLTEVLDAEGDLAHWAVDEVIDLLRCDRRIPQLDWESLFKNVRVDIDRETAPGVPTILGRCADCGVGTRTIGECYMATAEVWEQAWAGRRKPYHDLPGQQVLCIGCLELRIGRTLVRDDFTDAPTNQPPLDGHISQRMRDRLAAEQSQPL